MHFEQGGVYHIYNQGNNGRRIFLRDGHYEYFIRKMRQHLLPYGDLLCWCLMPNHFHWLFHVQYLELPKSLVSQREKGNRFLSLNDSIGILLRSYTRGINKELNWSGSLFRSRTKAKGGFIDEIVTVEREAFFTEATYNHICFNYIHYNPVKAEMVSHPADWPFSSAVEYTLPEAEGLCNKPLAYELGLRFTG